MRRGWPIVATIVGVLLLVGVGVAAYNAGLDDGMRRGAEAGQVVEVVGGHGYGWHGGWFFPFGFLFFPLIIIGTILLVRFAVGGRRFWGPGYGWGGAHGPASDEGRARFEDRFDEWHRRQHEQGSTSPDPGGGTTPDPGGGTTPEPGGGTTPEPGEGTTPGGTPGSAATS